MIRNGASEEVVAPLRDRLYDRLCVLLNSPIDELSLEIVAETRRQQRAEVTPAERRQLISDAVRRLRQRIMEKGFTRGPSSRAGG